jgi:4-hydroxysphinganine ceramide fatty acyl 2-hydroxylase
MEYIMPFQWISKYLLINFRYRLVFPVLPGYSLGIIIYYAFSIVFDDAHLRAFFTGIILGYLQYDMTHYYIHHSRPYFSRYRELKTYHMFHHYRDWDNGYGITNKFWDRVFGTLIDTSLV